MTADPYTLAKGSHTSAAQGRCAMEWVAYLAGEKHTDQPVCVSPFLRSLGIRLNDNMPDDRRQKLRPYLARMIGTAGDGRDPERVQMTLDWLVHEAMPLTLRNVDDPELQALGDRLASMSYGLKVEAVQRLMVECREAANEARRRARARLRAKFPAAAAYAAAAYAAYAYAYAADADAAAYAAAAYAYAAAAYAADADAAAYAAAAADAYAAAADAYAYAPSAPSYEELKKHCYAAAVAKLEPLAALLDRMLPTELIQLPVVDDAEQVCGIPVVA